MHTFGWHFSISTLQWLGNLESISMSKKILVMALVLYVVSATATFTLLSAQSNSNDQGAVQQGQDNTGTPSGTTTLGSLLKIDPNEPRDQACPLNGALYTATEKKAWEEHRPIAVMIENTPDARPQSGISNADVVFEAVAEGGVTRFMAFFYCGAQRDDILVAPVRSARSYFIDWASGFNRPLYVHVGGANLPGPANALGQLSDYGWKLNNDIDAMSESYPTFVRNYNRIEGKEVATEHTMESSTERIWKVADKRKWTNMSPERKVGKTVVPSKDWKEGFTPWTFSTEKVAAGSVTKFGYEFWSGYSDYAVEWQYDAATGMYKRVLGGAPHVDLNTNQQVMASTVVVLLTTEKGPIDEKKHMLYTTTGTGDALIYKNGEEVKARWSKKDREAPLTFVDSKGKDVALNPGLIWISVVDKATQIQK